MEGALHWGEPVMESAITLIADGRLYYRGHDALSLTASRTIEEVAALIWTGDFALGAKFFGSRSATSQRCLALRKYLCDILRVDAFQILVSLAAVDDISACDLRPEAVARTGARILRLVSAFASGNRAKVKSVAQASSSLDAAQAQSCAVNQYRAYLVC
jgi:citrate synthase